MSNFKCEDIIIGGVFILVINLEKKQDEAAALSEHTEMRFIVIQEFSENIGLVDIWRIFNTEAKRYN